MSDDLKEFYAVTMTSLYGINAIGKRGPCLEKLALHGESEISVGSKYNRSLLAIARYLQLYDPEGHERELARVNTVHWGPGTSLIVALFLNKKEAENCFNQSELQPLDERWVHKTREVVDRVGDNHPNITICHWNVLSLFPENAYA